jgi:hypothetical protein
MRHYHRIASIVLILVTLAANTVWAQSPPSSEDNRKWFVRTAVGKGRAPSRIHDSIHFR